jgi:PAS domain S-box-containing protein
MQSDIVTCFEAQADYLALVVGSLGLLSTIAFWLRGHRRPAVLSRMVWVLSVAVLCVGWWVTQRAGGHARQERIAQVSALAPTYAYEMARMGHYRIMESTQPEDPLYLSLIDAQIQWEKLNPSVNDIYTFRKRADGTNILVVDSETDYDHNGDFKGDHESRTPIGKVYPLPLEGLEKAFHGEANFDGRIYSDEWGTWVSAFEPMRDASGRIEAVLGVDFDARAWVAAIGEARRTVIFTTGLLLLIIMGAGLAIALLRADIVRRVEAEQRSRRAEERMQLTIRQMPLGFIEWNPQAEVVVWNPCAEKIFGYSAAEVLGKSIMPLIVAPAAREQADQVWLDLSRNAGGMHCTNENLTKDGRVIVCEWFNTPVIGADGKVGGVFSLLQDVTERVNLEKHLQQSDRLNAVGQLAAGIAHDFNNILTIITGHTGLLLANQNLPPQFRPELSRVEGAAIRAASLTRQLLTFSRKQAMFPHPLHLAKVVESTTSMLGRLLGANVKFSVRIMDHAPPVEADPAMMEQVLTNLVLNARDALSGAGSITVTLDATVISKETVALNPEARTGLALCLSVSDTGNGIAADHLPRIFEPFFTTKPTGQGTGLGLAVVHGIIQQHKGWITVESKPGAGSTFSIYLTPTNRPVSDASTGTFIKPPVAAASSRAILLAEDEEMVRELARATLQRAGYRVFEANDGHEALKVWGKHRDEIDLLLTDMVMPNGMTGCELSQRLLADQPDLPVIYSSGYSIELTAPGFNENERLVFLPKPYLTGQLLTVVDRCLSEKG